MRYVIKDTETGEYVRGESAWGRRRHPDINKAKLFHRAADAQAHIDRWKHRASQGSYSVVAVLIQEAPSK